MRKWLVVVLLLTLVGCGSHREEYQELEADYHRLCEKLVRTVEYVDQQKPKATLQRQKIERLRVEHARLLEERFLQLMEQHHE